MTENTKVSSFFFSTLQGMIFYITLCELLLNYFDFNNTLLDEQLNNFPNFIYDAKKIISDNIMVHWLIQVQMTIVERIVNLNWRVQFFCCMQKIDRISRQFFVLEKNLPTCNRLSHFLHRLVQSTVNICQHLTYFLNIYLHWWTKLKDQPVLMFSCFEHNF